MQVTCFLNFNMLLIENCVWIGQLCRRTLRNMLRKQRRCLKIQPMRTSLFSMGFTSKPQLDLWIPVSNFFAPQPPTLTKRKNLRIGVLYCKSSFCFFYFSFISSFLVFLLSLLAFLFDDLSVISSTFRINLTWRPPWYIQHEGQSKVGCMESCWR